MPMTPEPTKRSLRGWLAPALCICSFACSNDTAPEPEPSGPHWNLILISIDTLRADRLGCYGYATCGK